MRKIGVSSNNLQGDSLIINNASTSTIKFGFTGSSSLTFSLPQNYGSAGLALITDGSGRLLFGTPSGAIGATGTNGSSGTSGVSGTSGTSGIGSSGLSGTSGSSGTSGVGSSGTSGASGTSGTSGITIENGTSGTSGVSGSSGSSGTSGTSGVNGATGATGSANQTLEQTLALGNTTGTYSILFDDGSVGTPSISFTNDTDTGIYRISTDRFGIAAGGIGVWNITSAGLLEHTLTNGVIRWTGDTNRLYLQVGTQAVQNSGYILNVGPYASTGYAARFDTINNRTLFPDGTVGTPSITFNSDLDTGFYRYGNNGLSIVTAGEAAANFTARGIYLQTGGLTALSLAFIGDNDTGIYRHSTNQLAIAAAGTPSAIFSIQGINTINGTIALPAISFRSSSSTGFSRITASQINVSVDATEVGRFVPSGLRSLDGSVATPSISFLNDTDTGIYRAGTDRLAISGGGLTAAIFGSTNSIQRRTYFEKAVNHLPITNSSVSGTYSLDYAEANVWNLTLTGDTTLDYTNSFEGSYVIRVQQDGTGGRTLGFAGGGKFIGATAPSIGTASNAVSIIQLIHIGTQSIVSSQTNLINL